VQSDQPEEKKPETQAGGGKNRKPPRPTRIGTGGFDDDWGGKISDLRRYDLDASDPGDLSSWPMPGLVFTEIRSVGEIRSESDAEVLRRGSQLPPRRLPRMHNLAEVLTQLHAQRANLAYLIIGGKGRGKVLIGVTSPAPSSELETSGHSTLVSTFQNIYCQINIDDQLLPSDRVQSMVRPLTTYVGCLTGIPSFGDTENDTTPSQPIETILSGLERHHFGVLVLSVPIPSAYNSREMLAVEDQIERAKEFKNVDKEHKRKIDYFLELEQSYLKQLELGAQIGSWQVGAYYFARDRSVFLRLQSLLRAAYTVPSSRPTPFRAHEFRGLQEHLLQFGLLRNQRDDEMAHIMQSYKYLTPLNSQMLSAYIQVPAG